MLLKGKKKIPAMKLSCTPCKLFTVITKNVGEFEYNLIE